MKNPSYMYIKEITYYAHNCPGQYRNRNVAFSSLYTLSKLPTTNAGNQNILEYGHSQMGYTKK